MGENSLNDTLVIIHVSLLTLSLKMLNNKKHLKI